MALTNSVNASSQGYQVLNTSTGAWSGRTFQAGTGITLTNADGVAGNTSIATSSAVAISFATDSGSATPSSGTITFNATASAGSTVAFNGATSIVSFRVTDNLSNTIVGNSSGNGSISGNFNTGLGSQVFSSLSSGVANTAVGRFALNSITTQSGNVAVGANSLASASYAGNTNTSVGQSSGNAITSGSNNAILGYSAMGAATTASNSVAIGYLAYSGSTPTGSFNITIGSSAGTAYTGSESNNIIIANGGTIGDSNKIRIGTQGSGSGQQNECYIAGITGVTVSNPTIVTQNSSTGQMGTVPYVPYTAITIGIAFGGASTGVTYASQSGYYWQIAGVVYFNFDFVLSSKGSSTGVATLTGFPVLSKNDGAAQTKTIMAYGNNITLGASYNNVLIQMVANTLTANILQWGASVGSTQLTDAAFANNSSMSMTGFYFVNA